MIEYVLNFQGNFMDLC